MSRRRDEILDAIAKNQPPLSELPDISVFGSKNTGALERFMATLESIGGTVILLKSDHSLIQYFNTKFVPGTRNVTALPHLNRVAEMLEATAEPHTYGDVDNAVIGAHFGIAENGAVWVSDELMGLRVLPFICQHLFVVLRAKDVLNTMHEAYERIDNHNYDFGTFIAGPSKTADIEQSLVLGAHGPRTMTVCVVEE